MQAVTPEKILERPDEELVRQAQRGDAQAFSLLIRRYERRALAVAFAVLADGEAAGDAVQDAFLRAWQRLRELTQPQRFGPWLACIVRNLARDALRRRRRESRVRERLPLGGAGELDPPGEFLRQETNERLAAALAELDETTRAAVVLRYYENQSSRQIGDLLDLAPSAVDMRLSRARSELRKKLVDEL